MGAQVGSGQAWIGAREATPVVQKENSDRLGSSRLCPDGCRHPAGCHREGPLISLAEEATGATDTVALLRLCKAAGVYVITLLSGRPNHQRIVLLPAENDLERTGVAGP
ncbi:hypothetical protein SGFS_009060 [Streptomyces graminofaciens]|uniref:Uncharacterized protein n=1 Tax=Streptomyces graminofaciens TaxID=68212 RepID=A0ABN5VA50_9ACTN|nr:hypothetical protein SGFS_009060 [Streptomyces graminofaciens]